MLVYDDTSNEPVRIFDSGADLPDPETFGEYRLTYRTGDIVSPPVQAQSRWRSSWPTSATPSEPGRSRAPRRSSGWTWWR